MGLFEEVLLLREGYLVYQGPVDAITAYMSGLGYPCPPGVDVADFLIQVRIRLRFGASSIFNEA